MLSPFGTAGTIAPPRPQRRVTSRPTSTSLLFKRRMCAEAQTCRRMNRGGGCHSQRRDLPFASHNLNGLERHGWEHHVSSLGLPQGKERLLSLTLQTKRIGLLPLQV